MSDGKTVVAIMAHPDDAEICVGGTLTRFAAAGRPVHIVISSLPDEPDRRRAEAAEAGRLIGAEVHWVSGRETWQVEDVPTYRLVAEFDQMLSRLQPALVFTHWIADTHYDHVCVSRAVMSAMRRKEGELCACEPPNLLAPGAAAFQPNTFVDVTTSLEQSLAAVRAHTSQASTRGFEDQILARARFHGHRIGVRYAEAFQCVWRRLEI
jgi:LmbE family N-acetylglucosaminyl deacetylase